MFAVLTNRLLLLLYDYRNMIYYNNIILYYVMNSKRIEKTIGFLCICFVFSFSTFILKQIFEIRSGRFFWKIAQFSGQITYIANSPFDCLVIIRRLISVDTNSIFKKFKNVVSIFKVNWINVLFICLSDNMTMPGSTPVGQINCM